MTYEVARADLRRDRDEIVDLWQRHLPLLPFPERHFDWGSIDNPFAEGRVWKLIEGGHTRGVAGLVMRRLKVEGSVRLAGRLGGFAIDPQHRSLGPGLMLQRAVLHECGHDGLDIVYTSAPRSLVRMSARAGYRSVVALTRFVKLLDVEPFLRRRLSFAPLARGLAWPANLALRAAASLRPSRGVAQEIAQFDDRFDALWKRAAPHYGVTTERSARFLKWRFHDFPLTATFVTVGVSDADDDRLMGYAIYLMAGDVANLVDLFAEDSGPALHAVLVSVVRWLRSKGATAISMRCAGTGAIGDVLARTGFHERPDDEPTTLMVSPPADGNPDSALLRPSSWYFLAADDFWH